MIPKISAMPSATSAYRLPRLSALIAFWTMNSLLRSTASSVGLTP
jgi:hypothetical protein